MFCNKIWTVLFTLMLCLIIGDRAFAYYYSDSMYKTYRHSAIVNLDMYIQLIPGIAGENVSGELIAQRYVKTIDFEHRSNPQSYKISGNTVIFKGNTYTFNCSNKQCNVFIDVNGTKSPNKDGIDQMTIPLVKTGDGYVELDKTTWQRYVN